MIPRKLAGVATKAHVKTAASIWRLLVVAPSARSDVPFLSQQSRALSFLSATRRNVDLNNNNGNIFNSIESTASRCRIKILRFTPQPTATPTITTTRRSVQTFAQKPKKLNNNNNNSSSSTSDDEKPEDSEKGNSNNQPIEAYMPPRTEKEIEDVVKVTRPNWAWYVLVFCLYSIPVVAYASQWYFQDYAWMGEQFGALNREMHPTMHAVLAENSLNWPRLVRTNGAIETLCSRVELFATSPVALDNAAEVHMVDEAMRNELRSLVRLAKNKQYASEIAARINLDHLIAVTSGVTSGNNMSWREETQALAAELFTQIHLLKLENLLNKEHTTATTRTTLDSVINPDHLLHLVKWTASTNFVQQRTASEFMAVLSSNKATLQRIANMKITVENNEIRIEFPGGTTGTTSETTTTDTDTTTSSSSNSSSSNTRRVVVTFDLAEIIEKTLEDIKKKSSRDKFVEERLKAALKNLQEYKKNHPTTSTTDDDVEEDAMIRIASPYKPKEPNAILENVNLMIAMVPVALLWSTICFTARYKRAGFKANNFAEVKLMLGSIFRRSLLASVIMTNFALVTILFETGQDKIFAQYGDKIEPQYVPAIAGIKYFTYASIICATLNVVPHVILPSVCTMLANKKHIVFSSAGVGYLSTGVPPSRYLVDKPIAEVAQQ